MKSRSTPAATRSLMKMALRFRAAWAVGLLLLSTLPLVVQAQFDYTTDNGKVTITQYTGPGGEVIIPSRIDGFPVTTVEDWAFYSRSSLTSVTIPDNVTSIGLWAFVGCNNLTEIKVETLNSVYSSQDGVLFDKGQTALILSPPGKAASYEIPGSVINIGSSAFSGCSSLTSIVIPDSVTSIGHYAFTGCSSLTNVTIGKSVASIGEQAFSGCSRLTSITIPDSVTSIGNGSLPDPFGDPSGGSFSGCTSLTSVTIGNSVTGIGHHAFTGCSSLTNVTIGKSVASIGEQAFSGCSRLTSITIPDSVTSIGNGSLPGPFGDPPGGSFYGCTSLTSVTIGNSVTGIGVYAFYGCSSLTNVTIGKSVASIGDEAFSGCSSLTSITIPDSVTSIGFGGWWGKYGADRINGAFFGCNHLMEFTVDTLNPVYSSRQGVLFDKSQTALLQCPPGKAGSYTIPNGVTRIEDFAFSPCSNLTSVTIPDSVTSIGQLAFSGCQSLTAVYFKGNAPSFMECGFFYECSPFTSDPAIIYYLPGSAGWGSTFSGRPTVPWLLPLAREDVIIRLPGNGVRVAISVLLENDQDPQGGAVQFVGVSPVSANGGVLTFKEGQITYSPPPGVLADAADTFTYTISAGGGDAVGVVVVNVGSVDGLSGNLLSMEVSSEGVGLRFMGIVDTAYDIQRSPTLERPEWTTLGTRTADPVGRVQFLDTDPPSETGFYRTQKSPQP